MCSRTFHNWHISATCMIFQFSSVNCGHYSVITGCTQWMYIPNVLGLIFMNLCLTYFVYLNSVCSNVLAVLVYTLTQVSGMLCNGCFISCYCHLLYRLLYPKKWDHDVSTLLLCLGLDQTSGWWSCLVGRGSL